jgi:hypothetical protein
LLIEESRTNLILRSENFANASWVKVGGSISSVANVAPDGSANSELFSEDGTTSTHRTFQSFTGVSGTSYTLSVFLKFAGRDQIFLENRSIGTNPFVVFNIQNGTIGVVSAGLTAAIQAYPNGWYRCSITGTATLAGGNYLIGGYSGGAQSYTGLNGPAFYLYGAQVEAGSFATSYIPTTTTSGTRGSDSCIIDGISFASFFNQSEGTLFVSADEFRRGASYPYILRIATSLNPNNDRYSIGSYGNKTGLLSPLEFLTTSNSVQVYAVTPDSATSNFKASLAYKVDDMRGALNGTLLAADAPPSALVVGATTMSIGSVGMHINAVRYYRKRLPNEQLVELTT